MSVDSQLNPAMPDSFGEDDSELNPAMPDLVNENENIQPTAFCSVVRWSQNGRQPYEQLSNNDTGNLQLGPSFLPIAAYEQLHNSNHTLLKVRVITPGDEDVASSKIGTPSPVQDGHIIPSSIEVQSAIPHPAAAYCHSENGWIILEIRANKALPRLDRLVAGAVLPDEDRRQRSDTCKTPETHHFHQYKDAAGGNILDSPYSPTSWAANHSDSMHAFVCCRCTTYAITSAETIPGVIPVAILEAYIKERYENTEVGKTPQDMVACSLWSILRIIENYLWKGNNLALKSTSKFFARRIGWNEQSKQLWISLGFTYKLRPGTPERAETILVIPPRPSPEIRARLLRAWVELHAWLANYRRTTDQSRFAAMKNPRNQYEEFVGVEVHTETTQTLLGCKTRA